MFALHNLVLFPRDHLTEKCSYLVCKLQKKLLEFVQMKNSLVYLSEFTAYLNKALTRGTEVTFIVISFHRNYWWSQILYFQYSQKSTLSKAKVGNALGVKVRTLKEWCSTLEVNQFRVKQHSWRHTTSTRNVSPTSCFRPLLKGLISTNETEAPAALLKHLLQLLS